MQSQTQGLTLENACSATSRIDKNATRPASMIAYCLQPIPHHSRQGADGFGIQVLAEDSRGRSWPCQRVSRSKSGGRTCPCAQTQRFAADKQGCMRNKEWVSLQVCRGNGFITSNTQMSLCSGKPMNTDLWVGCQHDVQTGIAAAAFTVWVLEATVQGGSRYAPARYKCTKAFTETLGSFHQQCNHSRSHTIPPHRCCPSVTPRSRAPTC